MVCTTKSLYKSLEALDPNRHEETEAQKTERLKRERKERRKAERRKWMARAAKSIKFIVKSALTALIAVLVGWLMRRLGVF